MSKQPERDEALFDVLKKNKKKRRRKIILTVIAVVLVLAVILTVVVLSLQRQVNERFAAMQLDVLSYQASRGTISTTVAGTGVLSAVDLEQITVPAGVEIDEVLVETDDLVSQGDVLATVDLSSVMSAMSDLQAELDELDQQIGEAKGDEVSSLITAGVSGRVKILYAEVDTDVAACMAQHGALAVLSLDGYMAFDLETEALSAGDEVTVQRENGEALTGTVERVSRGIATVLITDNGPENAETVTALDEEGDALGSAVLYIHNPLRITGFAGTVSAVRVSLNGKVSDSTRLFSLKNTGYSANYDSLLRQRSEKEDTLLELLAIYRDGAILAPFSGMVSSVEYGEEAANTQSSASVSSYFSGAAAAAPADTTDGTALLTLHPNAKMEVSISIDETDILSLEIGQEAEVTVSSVSEEVFIGTVTQINTTASISTGVTQYSAVVTIPKTAGMLPGMTAEVDVKIKGVENAILIPVDALHQTSAISYVYTSYDEETGQYGDMVEVVSGLEGGNYVEIISGLSEGDTVYYTESQDFFSFFSGMGMGGAYGGGGFNGGFGGGPGMGGRR